MVECSTFMVSFICDILFMSCARLYKSLQKEEPNTFNDDNTVHIGLIIRYIKAEPSKQNDYDVYIV